jgi:hypothetical protein
MKTYPLVLASAVLLIASSVASAKTRTPRHHHQFGASGPTTTGWGGGIRAPSSTNPRESARNGLLQAPHEVPENGGAAMFVVPGWGRWR